MGEIRLYRKFYCISSLNGAQDYNLINPYSLSANTFVSGSANTQSNTSIETNIEITQSENGIYYVDLNPRLYAADVIYDLVWHVSYTSSAPNKKLVTRFKINPINIGRSIDVEMSERNTIEIEYPGSSIIEVEVLGNY
jgi:hypothetical protein